MRTFRVITSCNTDGWNLYGQRMVQSFFENWPAEVRITLYAEGFDPLDGGLQGPLDVMPLPAWLDNFKHRWLGYEAANGRLSETYNYRFDAVRFAHKTAAITDAIDFYSDDVLIWVDGDVFTHAKMPIEFLDSCLPEPVDMAWLDRPGIHPECGFVMYAVKHHDVRKMAEDWELLYRHDKVYSYEEWHDSYILQQMVHKWKLNVRSLSGPLRSSHPFINGPLGQYMDHLKGHRKHAGKSERRDLKLNRKEDYWKGLRS